MVATANKSTWQEKLVEVSKLRGQSGLAAFKRATILNEVFQDAAWRDRVALNDDDKAMAVLDEYVDDLALTFAEMREMLTYYPNREVWGTGKLGTLYREMREAQKDAGKISDDERPQRKRIRREDFEQLAKEKQETEHKVRQLSETVAQDRDEISALRKQNAELREKLAEANGRISQLEKMLNREMAAA